MARRTLIVLAGSLATLWVAAAPVLAYPWK